LVFLGLFVLPLGGGTGRTDRQTDEQHRYIIGPPSRKDGPIIITVLQCTQHLLVQETWKSVNNCINWQICRPRQSVMFLWSTV